MRVLLAVGTGDSGWVALAARLLPAGSGDLQLVHVVDPGPRREWEQARGRFAARAPLSPERRARLDQAEREQGAVLLARAETTLRATGNPLRITRHLLAGDAAHVLVDAARDLGAELIVIRVRERAAPAPAGPASVGHVARFVLDHAPCPVLLVRGQP